MVKGPGWSGKINRYRLNQRWRTYAPTELEAREAARYAHMSWAEYIALPGTMAVAEQLGEDDCKSKVLAHYRTMKKLEAVMAELQQKYPPPTPKRK